MKSHTKNTAGAVILCTLLAGCAAGYSPPPERRAADRCPIGEVWVCAERSPSRLEREDAIPPICRCENPAFIR